VGKNQAILARRLGPSEFSIIASASATVTPRVRLAGFGTMRYSPKVVGEESWSVMRGLQPSIHLTNGLLSDRFRAPPPPRMMRQGTLNATLD
jgi:hypothetical protein